ncbi:ParB/RepB/Spo0J family partition protein [Arthrobacter sp. zg-Y1219]|uniref:ParB/RepB/Spo0J family partition protein n=1 Tax=Arthrobacter sp. zg-Y1219 TaxID=3049067 RepID=UPI0024C32085|nr:ParB/RepB/Spo0J family partition protein [Arthrobacter sp. zg-Y1219]MDK1360635.1 ParB/RepB/Spo0J family partition protein [Arthrobacter sp. zg-Y1219]
MTEKRRGLGRGLGALIPSSAESEEASVAASAPARAGRPVDVFFPAAGDSVTPTRPAPGGARRGPGINMDALRGSGQKAAGTGSPRSQQMSVPGLDEGLGEPASGVGSEEPSTDGAADRGTGPSQPAKTRPKRGQTASRAASATGAASTGEPAENGPDAAAEADNGAAVSRETLVEVPGASFAEIPVDSIHPNRKQPRSVFDEDDMAELVHSIREIGVLQPIVVRPSPEDDPDHPYELVMGERRWRASREAGLQAVPAIIRFTQDVDLLRDALLENLHRSQLNPLEEAAAYQQLLDDFGCSHEELADRIGRSRPQVSNTLRLMKLPPLVQRRLAAGILSAGHSRALLGLADAAEMEKLAQRIVAEGLSVRATEEIVSMSDGLRRPAKESKPKVGARHERLDYLATSLSDRLDTNVKITLGARKGKVSIEFASVDDLNRIMGVLAPPSN